MREVIVIYITETAVVCISPKYTEKHLYLDKSYFPVKVSLVCKLIHIEYEYCD